MKENQHDQTVTEPAPTDSSDQVVEKPLSPVPKPAARFPKWAWLVLVIVIVIAAAVTLYFLVKPATVKQVKKAPSFASSQLAVAAVTAQINNPPLVVTSLNGLGGTTQDDYLVWDLPFYRVAGNKFLNAPTEGVGKAYAGNSIDTSSQFTSLSLFFKKYGYSQIEEDADFKGYLSYNQAVTFDDYRVYESDNMVCAVSHMDASDSLLKNHVASVGCAEKASYKKAAEALQPFYKAYVKGKSNPSSELVFGNAVEVKGSDGYRGVALYQEDPTQVVPDGEPNFFRGLYFKASGDNEWTYVTSARGGEILYCSEYSDAMLKKAFKGVTCFDQTTQKNSTVQ